MSNRRFEMYQYQHVIYRMRLGDSDRQINKAGLIGCTKASEIRKRAKEKGWLSLIYVAVSVACFWEISLKYALGKLELIRVKPEDLPHYAEQMLFDTLQISPVETSSFYQLPRLQHKDPFDRIIIWQVLQRKMTLISKDKDFQADSQ